jgi:hypothetical protein
LKSRPDLGELNTNFLLARDVILENLNLARLFLLDLRPVRQFCDTPGSNCRSILICIKLTEQTPCFTFRAWQNWREKQ